MATVADERLEQFLTQRGLSWEAIDGGRHASLCNGWNALYGDVLHWRLHREGAKAEFEYAREVAEDFLIVPFLGDHGGPHSIAKRGPRKAAYRCHGDGTLPNLSAFAETDFFVVPADLGWTMIHTHEDYELGGPYFVRKEWLGPPTTKRTRKRMW